MIDDEREVRAIEKRNHAIGVRGIDRVGEPDVLDACIREDFRLAQLRAANADGAAIDLPLARSAGSCVSWSEAEDGCPGRPPPPACDRDCEAPSPCRSGRLASAGAPSPALVGFPRIELFDDDAAGDHVAVLHQAIPHGEGEERCRPGSEGQCLGLLLVVE